MHSTIPVDWSSKESIKQFKTASEHYAKAWSKLSYEQQGWVCECISHRK